MELGLNANATLNYSYTFRNLTRLNVAAHFRHMNMDVYDDINILKEEENLPYEYGLDHSERANIFRSEINYQITGWRNADIRIGGRYDNAEYRELSAINFIDLHYFEQAVNGFGTWRYDILDDKYFPTRGMNLQIEGGAYRGWGHYDDLDGNNIPYSNVFYEGKLDLKGAIRLGSRITLIPQTWNRVLFGESFGFYRNYVGGTRYGRYTPSQMPFIGLNNTYHVLDKVHIARADLRFNLFKQHYLTLYTNYLYSWDIANSYFLHEQHFGLGAGYSLNTIVGPIQLVLHWSDISRSLGVHFSLGYDF